MTSFPKRHLRAVQDDPIMVIEQRPSTFTGHSWWIVLSYSTAEFEEMLPFDFPSLSDEDQVLVIAPIAERLRLKMKEVLDREDAVICPACTDGRLVAIPANEPFTNAHRQCDRCDGTFDAEDDADAAREPTAAGALPPNGDVTVCRGDADGEVS